eukprot:scaffold597081_cov17-Prasinocladus_malaysianus.AAC.1
MDINKKLLLRNTVGLLLVWQSEAATNARACSILKPSAITRPSPRGRRMPASPVAGAKLLE